MYQQTIDFLPILNLESSCNTTTILRKMKRHGLILRVITILSFSLYFIFVNQITSIITSIIASNFDDPTYTPIPAITPNPTYTPIPAITPNPTYTPIPAIPAITPPTILESATEYIKTFRKGQIAFNTPVKMFVGDTTEIEVKISDDLQRELEIKKNIGQIIKRDEIDIYEIMTAELTGIGFDIKPLQKDNIFLVLPSSVVSWRWMITPTKIGKQKLYLRINAKLRLDDFEAAYNLQNFERIIEVQVNPGKWFQSNWFKVIEIFLVIFGSGIVAFIASKMTVMKKLAKKINSWVKNITKKINSWVKNITKKINSWVKNITKK